MRTETVLANLMSMAHRHPRLTRVLLWPIARAPLVSRYMHIMPRAFMGMTAFELHDVDVSRGRISIGGVDEIMFSSVFLQLLHGRLEDKLGADEKHNLIYEIAKATTEWEINEALKHRRWVPQRVAAMVQQDGALESIRSDPDRARFFSEAMRMVFQLIINEGGWGTVGELDFRSDPMRATLAGSQEAKWLGPSERPICAWAAGGVAGYGSRMFGVNLEALEVQCAAMGARECVFEIRET